MIALTCGSVASASSLTIARSGTTEQALGVYLLNRHVDGSSLVGTLQLENLSGTWVYVEQDAGNTVRLPYAVYVLGPGAIKRFENFTFPLGAHLTLKATTPVGLGGSSAFSARQLALENAFIVDLMTRGLLTFALPPDFFDDGLFGIVDSAKWDFLANIVSTNAYGALLVAVRDRDPVAMAEALEGIAAESKRVRTALAELLKTHATDGQLSRVLDNIVQIVEVPEKYRLLSELHRATLAAPPESTLRLEVIDRAAPPTITSVSPAVLTTQSLTEHQTLTIHGTGLSASTSLLFTNGSTTYISHPDRISSPNSTTLHYDFSAGSATGTWTITLAEGTGAVSFEVTADNASIYTLTPTSGAHGTISPGTPLGRAGGESQTFVATPQDESFTVDTWYVDGVAVTGTANRFTLADIQASHTVSVTFKSVAPAPPGDDHGDRSFAATPLVMGDPTQGRIDSPTDLDWFSVEMPNPGTLSATLAVPAGKDYDLELFGPSGAYIKGSYAAAGVMENLSHAVTTAGRYYFRILGYPFGHGAFDTVEPYTLTCTMRPGPGPQFVALPLPTGADTNATLRARGLSEEAGVVVGQGHDAVNGYYSFRWRYGAPLEKLTASSGDSLAVEAVSLDGTVLAGTANNTQGTIAAFVRQSSGAFQSLGTMSDQHPYSYGTGLSADGRVAVGYTRALFSSRAFRWSAGAGMQDLGQPNGVQPADIHASAASSDGSVIVGYYAIPEYRDLPPAHAFRWTNSGGIEDLAPPAGKLGGYALGVSGDGEVVVGVAANAPTAAEAMFEQAWVWRRSTGTVALASSGFRSSRAQAISADGKIIVGSGTKLTTARAAAVAWDAEGNLWDIQQLLAALGADLTGWELSSIDAVTGHNDVYAFAGNGIFAGKERAFLVTGMVFPPQPVAPKFKIHPTPQNVAVGDWVSFVAEASGHPAPTLQWRKNGVPVAALPGTSFNQVAAASHNGVWDVLATNSAGVAISQPAIVTVTGPPVITAQPTAQTTVRGSSATFTIAVDGYPTPHYQWQSSNDSGTTWSDLADDSTHAGTLTNTLELTGVAVAMNGWKYRVLLDNNNGPPIASNAVVLTVDAGEESIDVWHWRNPRPHGQTVYGLAYGNGRFLALCGQTGSVLVSSDGVNWTFQTVPTFHGLGAAIYTQGQFVVVGGNGTILTSPDTLTWTPRNSGTSAHLSAIARSADRIVAVGANGAITTSVDGETWTPCTTTATTNLRALHYAHGRFVAAGWTTPFSNDSQFLVSEDGLTWTVSANAGTPRLNAIAANATGFVGVGEAGTIAFSSDGLSWTAQPSPTTQRLSAIALVNGTFVAVGGGYPYQPGVILTSPDGLAWTARDAAGASGIHALVSSPGLLVAGGEEMLTSTDAQTWQKRTVGFTTNLADVIFDGTRFIAVGENGIVASSLDGAAWEVRNAGTHHNGIAFGQGKYVVVGAGGEILTSTNAQSWVRQTSGTSVFLYDVTYGNGLFVAVGAYGVSEGTILTSNDGIHWTQRVAPTGPYGSLRGVTFGAGRFVAVGDGEAMGGVARVMSSADGITWTKENPGVNTALEDVVFANGRFVALGAMMLISDDGKTWAAPEHPLEKSLFGLAFGAGRYVAVGHGVNGPVTERGIVNAVSLDGHTWSAHSSGTSLPLNAVAFGHQTFVAVGQRGTILQSGLVPPLPPSPTISTSPANTTVEAGDDAVLTSFAVGTPAPTARWQRSTDGGATWNDLAEGETYQGVATFVLRIRAATLAMNGDRFRIIATNGTLPVGVSSSATLTVIPPPVRYSLTVTTDGPGTATLLPTGRDGGPGSRLFEAGAEVQLILQAQTGARIKHVTYSPMPAIPDTLGMYIVLDSLSGGTGSGYGSRIEAALTMSEAKTISVTFEQLPVAPNIQTQPANQSAAAGASATFSIVASGNPSPSYTWQRQPASSTDWVGITDGQVYSGTASSVLTVAGVTLDMSGDRFRCLVSNGAQPDATSDTVSLTVTNTFTAWLAGRFTSLELQDLNFSGPLADPDGDSLPNLIEYALDLAPLTPNASDALSVQAADGNWICIYTRPRDRNDLSYVVEASTDLVTWTTAGVTHQLASSTAGTETWRATYPLDSASLIFFRLRITRP